MSTSVRIICTVPETRNGLRISPDSYRDEGLIYFHRTPAENQNDKKMIHIYTGNGKGKTTAALGLSLRAAGAGLKVYIAQFVKGMVYNEAALIASRLPEIELELFGRDCFIEHTPEQADIEAAQAGFTTVKKVVASGKFDMVILDELNIALYYRLLPLQEIVEWLNNFPDRPELIITGRYAPPEIIEKAHLVTEMKEVKHYYHKGVEARKGIEW